MKQCCRCEAIKSKKEFHKNKNHSDGIESYCKRCHQKRMRLYYKNNKETYKDYYSKNFDSITEKKVKYSKKYSATPRGCYTSCKRSAKARGLNPYLTFEEFLTFWQKPCFYCGEQVPKIGIDRFDSSKGYLIDNCVSCCEQCNYMKLDYTVEEFLNHCAKIAERHGIKNV